VRVACTPGFTLAVSALPAEYCVIDSRAVIIADGDMITILDLDKRQHKIRFNSGTYGWRRAYASEQSSSSSFLSVGAVATSVAAVSY